MTANLNSGTLLKDPPKKQTKPPASSRWGEFPPPPVVTRPDRRETLAGSSLWERAAALVMLILLSPLFLALAVANKIDCPKGTIFYRQERVGLERRRQRRVQLPASTPETPYSGPERRSVHGYGRIFKIWKFRTMVPDAEARSGPVWASVDDPRVTRLGRTLRNLRLDELPQLINVVAGQMSLIGPRPERPHFVGQLAAEMPSYEKRLQVSPGITGLAQVEREYDASILDVRTKLKYDIFYVENRSRLMDLKIILKTVDVMLRGRGAR